MIALLFAILLLAFAVRRILFNPSQSHTFKKKKSKPSAAEKIAAEAFEYPPSDQPTHPILILYATEYGFAREVARAAARTLSQAAIHADAGPVALAPRIVNVLHYPILDLTRETFVVFVCSTTGDGVPPNEAAAFRDALVSRDVVLPQQCRHSVLALGDKAYPHFCRAGAIFDSLFGDSSRMLPCVNVDQEDWSVINTWISDLTAAISKELSRRTLNETHDYLNAAIDKYASALENNVDACYTRNNPFLATVTAKRLLTAPRTGAPDEKEVVRVEFDISGSSMKYESGDALAVVPENNPEHVTLLLRAMASNGDELVRLSDKADPMEFEAALSTSLDIATVKPDLIAALGRRCEQESERELAEKILGYDPLLGGDGITEFGKAYAAKREVFDVLNDFVTASMSPQQLTSVLRPLHARYYSISSTPVTSPDVIATTVDVLRYSSLNIERQGVASTYLRERCKMDSTKVPVFISKNPNFRLPKDDEKPIIMIGPGTGLAPFVAFVEERIARNASGENRLFFGCRHEKQDFLYRDELASFAADGCLKLHTAFSRDGKEKVYVQHQMKEYAEELWQLIDGGAHVYVCGDGGRMAGDVDRTLCNIVGECGSMSEEDAAAYLEQMSEQKRYQRDVWVS